MKKQIMIGFLIAIAIILMNISSAQPQNSGSKISLQVFGSEEIDKEIPVIILLKDNLNIASDLEIRGQQKYIEETQSNLLNSVQTYVVKGDATNVKSLWLINAVSIKAKIDVITEIAKREDVERIEYDSITHVIGNAPILNIPTTQNSWGIEQINAPAVWEKGYFGNGVVVAVVDTGIDSSHPDLNDLDDNPSTNDPKVILWKDYVNGLPDPYDDYGHGTHVSGIISGTGEAGVKTGVAPRTKLIVAKAFDNTGNGRDSDSIAAFGWAVENKADIISYSAIAENDSDIWTQTISNVVKAGVVPVIAAGNYGPESQTIKVPANKKQSIAVGATDIDDMIAMFSSRGPVILDNETYIKPDVSAPGVFIISTLPGGIYSYASGTSMSAPFVSGTAALILEKNPDFTPEEVKNRLENTADDLGIPGKDNEYGSGRIDTYRAVFMTNPPAVVSIQETVGTMMAVPIKITNVEKLSRADILLSYDKNVVIVENITEGNLGNQITTSIDNANGTTRMKLVLPSGKTGDFVFAYVSFKEVGSPGQISNLSLIVKELVDNDGNNIVHRIRNGKFTVSEIEPVVDINITGRPVINKSTIKILHVDFQNFKLNDPYNIDIMKISDFSNVYSRSGILSGGPKETISVDWIPKAAGDYIVEARGDTTIGEGNITLFDSEVISPVPEIPTLALLSAGLLGLFGLVRRQKNN